jgi:hypothetical protein
LACGTADNGVGIAGAGYGCSILNAKTNFDDSQVAAAIEWATDEGAKVINMSFGSRPGITPRATVEDALRRAVHGRGARRRRRRHRRDRPGASRQHLQPTGTGPDLDEGLGLSVTVADAADAPGDFGFGPQISLAAYGSYDGQSGPPGILGAYPATQPTGFELPDPLTGRPPCALSHRPGRRPALRLPPGHLDGRGARLRRRRARPLAESRPRRAPGRPPAQGDGPAPGGGGWTPELGWGILDAGAAVAKARTLDVTAPTSKVKALPARVRKRLLSIGFVASDEGPSRVRETGVSRVDVFMRRDRWRMKRIASVRGRQAAAADQAPARPPLRLRDPGVRRRGQSRADAHAAGPLDPRRRLARRRLGFALAGGGHERSRAAPPCAHSASISASASSMPSATTSMSGSAS